MAKYNIDDILSELGVGDASKRPKPQQPQDADPQGPRARKKHRIDQAASSFSPLPSVPGNQRNFGQETPDADTPRAAAPVGPALSDIYNPEASEDAGAVKQLGETLLAEKLALAQGVLKQSPGKRLTDVLIEQGVDEAAVLQCVAEFVGVPFERVDLSRRAWTAASTANSSSASRPSSASSTWSPAAHRGPARRRRRHHRTTTSSSSTRSRTGWAWPR
jgi:hypothetical protein